MTNRMKDLISQSNYLVDYEARDYKAFDFRKSPQEIYEQLCDEYGVLEPNVLEVDSFENWVNENYYAFDILQTKISLPEIEEVYRSQVLDPAIEDFFTNSYYFAWL